MLGLATKRIQFTPDLMPADIVGSEVLEEAENGRRSFRFIKGPVFAQLLMADEINRASPRTQSALLQAMQEHHVTVAGMRYDLPHPFHVLATQNPLEQEGTYPLPEAQLDRFLMQIDVGYPDLESEKRVLLATTGVNEEQPKEVIRAQDIMFFQRLVRAIPGRRKSARRDLGPGAQRASRRRRCRRHQGACRLGPKPARQPGVFAGRARPRPDRRPLRAVGR